MNGFKFRRVKNKFRWESDFMVLEFSNPSIQGFSDYTILENEKEILYYYYTVKIFKKITDWDDNDNEVVKWKLLSERGTHDFPTITQLKWILDYQLNDDTRIDGQKIEYQSGKINYSKTVSSEGFGCDDFYEVTKIVNEDGKPINYVVYTGVTYDCQGDLNSAGIRTQYVCQEDIKELLKCVTGFIQYSIEDHNELVFKQKDNYKIKGNKIYEYAEFEDNKLESIYIVGDILDMTTVVDNEEKEYCKVTPTKIENNYIYLDDENKIDVNSVAFIMDDISEEKLKYNESEIAEDFINILSNEEKEEFKSSDVDYLLGKYKSAIINRTAMCRDEHDFDMDYHGDRVENVTPVVKSVINIIKSNLNK